MNDRPELVHGFVGLETEAAETQPLLEVEVVDLAVPAPGMPLERRVRRQGQIRTDEIRWAMIPAVPSRCQPTDVEGDLSRATRHVTHEKGAARTVRGAYVEVDIPAVPLGQKALIEALTTQGAVGSDAAGGVPTLRPDVFEQTSGGVPGVELDVDRHVFGNQAARVFQDLSRQAILADGA
ncbi:MAG: hypothetical protein PVG71_06520 [Anaerolineae bacterium]